MENDSDDWGGKLKRGLGVWITRARNIRVEKETDEREMEKESDERCGLENESDGWGGELER